HVWVRKDNLCCKSFTVQSPDIVITLTLATIMQQTELLSVEFLHA
ncbi:unnamed protein product, partial [Musa banksii]